MLCITAGECFLPLDQTAAWSTWEILCKEQLHPPRCCYSSKYKQWEKSAWFPFLFTLAYGTTMLDCTETKQPSIQIQAVNTKCTVFMYQCFTLCTVPWLLSRRQICAPLFFCNVRTYLPSGARFGHSSKWVFMFISHIDISNFTHLLKYIWIYHCLTYPVISYK